MRHIFYLKALYNRYLENLQYLCQQLFRKAARDASDNEPDDCYFDGLLRVEAQRYELTSMNCFGGPTPEDIIAQDWRSRRKAHLTALPNAHSKIPDPTH